jgi:integrase/recombinase XerD
MTPTALLDEFARHLRVERGLSENTFLTYTYQLKGYMAFLAAAGKEVLAANRADILTYLEVKKKSGHRSATLFGCAIVLRQFHRFLKEQGHTKMDATQDLRLPKIRQRLPEPVAVDAMKKLLDLPMGTKFHHVRMAAALEVLYATGMRVSELIQLRPGQINFEESWIRVMGKGGKERLVPIGDRARRALISYLEAKDARFPLRGDALFLSSRGRLLTRGAFWGQLRALAQRIGLQGRLHPHRIRHSAASHMLAGGADIRILQELLGHRSISTTQRYTHVNPELLKQTCRKTHPRF